MALKIKINEQAVGRLEFIASSFNIEDEIFCHCSYFLVYNMPQTDSHWKQDIYGFIKKIKSTAVSSGNKLNYVTRALVDMAHGEHFLEDRDDYTAVFKSIYESEDIPHPFDFDMELEHNRNIYFDALNKFYYEFLLPWVAIPDKNPPRKPLYDAIDKYLIARRTEMIPL